MVLDRETAARKAESATSFGVGMCQLWTRELYEAPAAGDLDTDGDADAVDGWLSEPVSARHLGDRTPPRGYPVAFSGGSRGFGHRAISLGGGKIRSTDMFGDRYRAGTVGTTTISSIEKAMGVSYLGWSETISGFKIPDPEWEPRTRGGRVRTSINRLQKAERIAREGTRRDVLLERALTKLRRIPFLPRKLKK